MKKIILFSAELMFCIPAIAQIKVVEEVESKKQLYVVDVKYDSTNITWTNGERYLGQRLFTIKNSVHGFREVDLSAKNLHDMKFVNPGPNKYFDVLSIVKEYKTSGIVYLLSDSETKNQYTYELVGQYDTDVVLTAYIQKLISNNVRPDFNYFFEEKDGFWKLQDVVIKNEEVNYEFSNKDGLLHYQRYLPDHKTKYYYESSIIHLKKGEFVVSKNGEYGEFDSLYVINGIPYVRFSNKNNSFQFNLTVSDLPTTKNALDYGLLPYYTKKEAIDYIKRFGSNNWSLILRNQARIGMTKEMVEMSLGEPFDINITRTSLGNNEQWVYTDSYVYFTGNKVTAIQD